MKNINYVTYDNIDKVIDKAIKVKKDTIKSNKMKKKTYYNLSLSFDIETSSFYIDENGNQIDYETKIERLKICDTYNPLKVSNMYIWQLNVNGYNVIGRTWEEFQYVIDRFQKRLNLSEDKILVIYVHNLAYEFQFMKEYFTWISTFNIDTRKPLYALCDKGVEFRCSYLLSGYSLEKLAEKTTVKKMVGDLDYSKVRNSLTELTDEEITYCINDVQIVYEFIKSEIERNNGITNIPLTKTGYVRNHTRKHTMYTDDKEGKYKGKHIRNFNYSKLIQSLTIDGAKEFKMMERAFQGGFTHANAFYVNDLLDDVSSYDFTSSYPSVMLCEKYPTSRGIWIDQRTLTGEKFKKFTEDDNILSIFDVSIFNLKPRFIDENILSISRCTDHNDVVQNNGRVVYAKMVKTTVTNIDYLELKKFYEWDYITVGDMYIYKCDYLPKEFINIILDLYEKKTTLKGIEGSEYEYMKSKEMLNSLYGMCVTNPVKDLVKYDNENGWYTEEVNIQEKIDEYNGKKSRFLTYSWGIFITAYARKNLYTGILEFGEDYIYSDTDSLKVFNHEKHQEYLDQYNSEIEMKLLKMCNKRKIDFNRCKPKNKKGSEKLIGIWDYEGTYNHFKTLGAKRYMYSCDNALRLDDNTSYPINLTVSGINKKKAIPYLYEKFDGDVLKIFNHFQEYMKVPPEYTGKLLHTYIDEKITVNIEDYQNHITNETLLSGVHLEPTGYDLSLATLYARYLLNIRQGV